MSDDNEEHEKEQQPGNNSKKKTSRQSTGLTTQQQALINIAAPKITSFTVDPYLAKIITLIYFAAANGYGKKPNAHRISLEESRYDTTFLYYFENKKLGLAGYVGRDKETQVIRYMIVDNSRFKWAIMEGFVTPNDNGVLDVKDREFVYNNIGVFRAAKTINDFVDFISGNPKFEMKGDYYLCPNGTE